MDNKPIEEAVDLLNLNTMPSGNVSTPSKTASSNFDLLGGLDTNADNSFGEFSSGAAAPDLLGQPNISRNSSANDVKVGSSSGDLLFDPFGNAQGKNEGFATGWDIGGNKASVTPPESQNSKPSSLFSDLGKLLTFLVSYKISTLGF